MKESIFQDGVSTRKITREGLWVSLSDYARFNWEHFKRLSYPFLVLFLLQKFVIPLVEKKDILQRGIADGLMILDTL